MKTKKLFFAVLTLAALSAGLVSCDDAQNLKDQQYFYVTVVSSNEVMGTVKGEGNYPAGAKINIMATPNLGFVFQKWDDGNTDNPRTITVTGDATYTAIFAANPNGNESGHDYVDLGLPSGTKWATCNVGATAPEEYGDYFAWGETEPKTTYDWNTYKWATATWDATYESWQLETLTKYCTSGEYGTVDNKTVLDLEDDAAHANRGGAWRMPTDAEWTELRENCTWTWTSDYNGTGVAGRIVTSKINGNSIFLPAAGVRDDRDFGLLGAGDYGGYWSSSLGTDNPKYAWNVYFDSGNVDGDDSGRYGGLSVRPVCK